MSVHESSLFKNEKIGLINNDGHELREGDLIETPNNDWGIIRYNPPYFGVTIKVAGDERIFTSCYTDEWLMRCKFIGNVNDKPILLDIIRTHEEQQRILGLKNIDYDLLRKTYITI